MIATLIVFFSFSSAAFLSLVVVRSLIAPPVEVARTLSIRSEWLTQNQADSELLSQRFDVWFATLIARSGLGIDRFSAILILSGTSLLSGIAAFVFDLPAFVQLLCGLLTFSIGILILFYLKRSRVRNFSMHLPTSLELLARSIHAGEDLESAMNYVRDHSEEPVAAEFTWCCQQIKLGLSPTQVTADLAVRIPTMDVQLFAHTIAIHRSLGGKLSDSLDRLSTVIRDRQAQLEKIRSITGMGRFAVFAILLMAIFALVYLSWMHPEYIAKLYDSPLGRKMLMYAAVSEVVGIIWSLWTLKSEL